MLVLTHKLALGYEIEYIFLGLDDGEFIGLHVSYVTVNTTSKRRRKGNYKNVSPYMMGVNDRRGGRFMP